MEFTGSDLSLKRNLYTQNDRYGFALSCTVDNTTGRYLFGLSGAGGVLEFKLESGRMYYGDQFLHTYRSSQAFALEGDFTSGTLNIVKDGAALMYGALKGTGAYDYFYFKRDNAGMAADFDLTISGSNTPKYAIQNIGYLVSSGQNAVTGYFTNQSTYPIRVFDSSIQATQLYDFGKLVGSIGVGTSGQFAYSGDFSSIDLTQPILTTFNTNFADATVLFSIIDVRSLSRFIQLTGPTDFTFVNNELNRDCSYLNYSGGFVTNAFNAGLQFSLQYVGGALFTGTWALATGIMANSLVSVAGLSSNTLSGSGQFPPNSFVNFDIIYSGASTGIDIARFMVSGSQVLNPISQTFTF